MNSYQMRVRDNVTHGGYRNGFEKSLAFVLAKISATRFIMNDIAQTLKREHRIMVQHQSS
jgi:hypothetical protein